MRAKARVAMYGYAMEMRVGGMRCCQCNVSAARRMARLRLCIRVRNPSSHEPPPFHFGGTLRVGSKSSDANRTSISGGPAVVECPKLGGSLDR
jgi:hypothetical protein